MDVRTVGLEPANSSHEMAVLQTAVFAVSPRPQEAGSILKCSPLLSLGTGGPRIRVSIFMEHSIESNCRRYNDLRIVLFLAFP